MDDSSDARAQRFQSAYESPDRAPWDIDRPQPAFVQVAEQIHGSVLDVGCGTGENALFFAQRGCQVIGVDCVETALAKAREKAVQRNLHVDFRYGDVLELHRLFHSSFDCVLDCGLFHIFSDAERPIYVSELSKVLRPQGRLFLLCFSENEPAGAGPRRVTQAEIIQAFSGQFRVCSLRAARFEIVTSSSTAPQFSEGGAHAWFAILERCA